ncbi:ATP-binding protein [Streptomyces sp. NRRL B-1677]|uniref:ATP-binding protein n=1 Tax=Streptomyces sp. NRRL B-1677 TaxID=2682966 RepID=UPI001892BC90|nr:ATP-binding protein [Streptomyces sp. NRRL B-1677]MBF6044380.1 ATP-binding protein [Streptomyces sp. NRRL B-1677]
MLLPAPKLDYLPAPEIEPFEYRLRVPNDARAVPIARGTVRAVLTAHGLAELLPRAELLASELLTNAIVHTVDDAELCISWSQWDVLRLTACDTDDLPLSPHPDPHPHPYAVNGRGLTLLRSLADNWGHYSEPHGFTCGATKAVWCSLTRSGQADTPRPPLEPPLRRL